jgi:hypothetical protein
LRQSAANIELPSTSCGFESSQLQFYIILLQSWLNTVFV